MNKLIAMFFTVLVFCMALSANAGEFEILRSKLNEARSSLVTFMMHAEHRNALQQKLVKDTADAVSVKLASMQAPVGKEGRFIELVETWKVFKETREKDLVPAILRGDEEAAKKLAWGVQKERFTKCMALARELDQQKLVEKSYGSGFQDLGLAISEARLTLVNMMRNPKNRGAEQQKQVKLSAEAVNIKLADLKAPYGKEAQFNELVETWNAFLKTRNTELVPAILSGNDEEAKRIAHGIQQERYTKILALNKELSLYSLMPPPSEVTIEEFRVKISMARDTLMVMLKNKDKRDEDQQKLVKESAEAVSEHIEKLRVPAAKQPQLNLLIETWNKFRETREKELVPAILAGKEAEAKKIAYGVQNERFMKCLGLAASLDY